MKTRLKKIKKMFKFSKISLEDIIQKIILILVVLSFLSFGFFNMFSTFKRDCKIKISNICEDEKYKYLFRKISIIKAKSDKIDEGDLKRSILNEVLSEYIAKDLGINISDEVILDAIKKINIFQEKNEFKKEQYDRFLKYYNITTDEYIKELRNEDVYQILDKIISNISENKNNDKVQLIERETKEYTFEVVRTPINKIIQNIKINENTELENLNNKITKKRYIVSEILEIPEYIYFENKKTKLSNFNISEVKSFLEYQIKKKKTLKEIARKLNITQHIKIIEKEDMQEINEDIKIEEDPEYLKIKLIQDIKAEEREGRISEIEKERIIEEMKRERALKLIQNMNIEDKVKISKIQEIKMIFNSLLKYDNDNKKQNINSEYKFLLMELNKDKIYQNGDILDNYIITNSEVITFRIKNIAQKKLTEEERAKITTTERELNKDEIAILYRQYILKKYNISIDLDRISQL